jgi:aryl-alcohol dehydrogenase-like predicted oxidoreductase
MINHPKTRLGDTGPEVFPIGLGCMGMSSAYGKSNDEDGIATIHAAVERGVTLLDTGDFYGMGHNEMLIRRAVEGRRDRVLLSVKFGALRGPDNSWGGVDTRPAAVKNFAAYSLKRLGVDVIDVYRPARLDPNVPIEETVGAIADLVTKGYVRHIGLSEVGVETISRAHRTHPIVDLQIEYSILSRAPEDNVFPLLERLGISATLYSVLGRGQLGGKKPGPGDFRNFFPRFSAENRATNDALVGAFTTFAVELGMTPGQLAVAWALAKQPRLVPVIGARTVEQLDDALGALAKPLSTADVERLERVVPKGAAAGARYAPAAMASLDSER